MTFQDPTGSGPRLIDDRTEPDFRSVFGALLAGATALDTAVTRVRLSTLDLSPVELGSVRRIRLLVAQLDAATLDVEAHAAYARPELAANLGRLADRLASGSVLVRSAPLAGWSPDFSVFHRAGPHALLLGPHRFHRGCDVGGPTMAALLGEAPAARAAESFEGVWARAHDVGAPVLRLLSRSRDGAPGGPPERRRRGPDGVESPAHETSKPVAAQGLPGDLERLPRG